MKMITDLVTVMIMMILPPDTGLVSDCSLAWSRAMCDYRVVCLNIESLGVMTVVMEQSARSLYHGDHYQLAAEMPLTTLPLQPRQYVCLRTNNMLAPWQNLQIFCRPPNMGTILFSIFSAESSVDKVVRGRVAQCAMCNL